ncbi:MAG: helix-turn-helix transcriptional regulator [Candidatus Aminicenantes bacterium]|nr:helix-turn-helix transcriptional regulator [Candidatus Aminicenantes bacterium]
MRMGKIGIVIKDVINYRHPETYQQELNCQCRVAVLPMSILLALSWIPFSFLDRAIHPDTAPIFYIRWGLPVIAFIGLIFQLIPYPKSWKSFFAKNKSYVLAFLIMGYLQLSTSLILGLVTADPIYMGSYSSVILLLPLLPFKVKHSLMLFGLSLGIFIILGSISGMDFDSSREIYGLFNLVSASGIALVAIFILDMMRKNHYLRSLVIQRKRDEKVRLFFQKYGISSREQEIAYLIIEGKSNREIEDKLYISIKTVRNHIYNIYQKMDVNSRLQFINLINNIKNKT